jgi:hypothetical protein
LWFWHARPGIWPACGDDMSFVPLFDQKNKGCIVCIDGKHVVYHSPKLVAGKKMFLFFQLKNSFSNHFLPKTLRKHHWNLVKSINDLQKHKKTTPKTYNQLETKNLFELRSVFLGDLKVKKHIILTLIIIYNYLT